uniref:DNA-directed RNA polymerase n=1 Tax=Chloroparvula japonica TaxID=1411623 RepID=A0A4D6C306_9CHLO|nr:beta'' subunit of RNA polymerase [Chloroparvula japonica]QBX98146.1 beta'' subunit of RNA polymerase [Chloroparvula japonica]
MCTPKSSIELINKSKESSELTYWFINQHLEKGNLKGIISWLIKHYGGLRANGVLERLKRLGFEQAMQAGVSIGAGDITPPPMRDNFVTSIGYDLLGTSRHYNFGQLTAGEKAQRAIDGWFSATELLRRGIVLYFNKFHRMSPMHMMAFSGARGNMTQVRQLMGLRGLMLDPLGQIITSPIRASFREGLTVTEYLISAYGARKGLVDTALRTANAGYLTRRLIDVLQDVVVIQVDCGPIGREGIFLTDLKAANGKSMIPLRKRLVGRVLTENLYLNNQLIERDRELNPVLAELVAESYPSGVYVRSAITCGLSLGQTQRSGICQLCYGWDLSLGDLVELGEAVGILAAQSIGEPGTQLTMRTFHTGGVISGQALDRLRASGSGRAIYPVSVKGRLVRSEGGMIGFFLYQDCNLLISRPNGKRLRYQFPQGVILLIRHGEWIQPMQELAQTTEDEQLNRANWLKKPYQISSQLGGSLYFVGQPNVSTQNTNLIDLWILSGARLPQRQKYKSFSVSSVGDWVASPTLGGSSIGLEANELALISGLDTITVSIQELPLASSPGTFVSAATRSNKNMFKRFQDGGRVRCWSRERATLQRVGRLLSPTETALVSRYGLRIDPGMSLGRVVLYTPVAGDITQALPKIEAFFEARSYQPFHRALCRGFYTLLSLGFSRYFAAVSALKATQLYIREAIQTLYFEQGIDIDDRHIELVIGQMGLMLVTKDDVLFDQSLSQISVFESLVYESLYPKELVYEPVIIGITKSALRKGGFLAPASFQETVRVLTRAGVENKKDRVNGLKESIILGRPLSVGTGWCVQSNYLS